MFYGIEQSSPWQDIVASFLTSLFATAPGFIISILFVWTGPGEVPATKRVKVFSNEGNGERTQPITSGSSSSQSTTMETGHSMTESTSVSETNLEESETVKSEYTQIQEKVEKLEEMRKHFYNYNFPFPPITRKIAWVILVLWSAAATVTAVSWICLYLKN